MNQSTTLLLAICLSLFTDCSKKSSPNPDPVPTPTSKEAIVKPQYLAIYYAWPSVVNGATSMAQAVNTFKQFDIIVLGDKLWTATHPDCNNTRQIIQDLKAAKPTIKIYGYIDVGVSGGSWIQNLSEVQLRQAVDGWKATGATGVFGDDFGSDFGVTRPRQNLFIDYAHNSGLSVFANSWWVKDALGGSDCHLGANDYYLLESFLMGNGAYYPLSGIKAKGDSVISYKKQSKVNIAVSCTVPGGTATASSNTGNPFSLSWYGTAMYNFEAFQFTDNWHSASNAKLYFYPNPISSYGTIWKDTLPVRVSATQFKRGTDTHTFFIEGDGVSSGRGYAQ